MKIQSLGNGTGRPVNPFEEYQTIAGDSTWKRTDEYKQFFKDNPALPLYLNNEPYLGSDLVEVEIVWQGLMWEPNADEGNGGYEWQVIYDSYAEWFNRQHNTESEVKKTRQIYIITPSAPDNDKKVAEAREGMEFKGTPGPWALNGYEYDMGRHVYSIQGGTHRITMPDGSKQQPTIGMVRFRGVYQHNVVLDENGQSDMINQSEVKHLENARLISAAPELLEALQNLMNHYEQHGQLLTWNVDIARQAINKALGTI